MAGTVVTGKYAEGPIAAVWPIDVGPQDGQEPRFALATTPGEYADAAASGRDPILVQLRSSAHFETALPLRLLGRAALPWRWRRTLMNEGIGTVFMAAAPRSLPILVGCLLAGASPRLGTPARRSGRRPRHERAAPISADSIIAPLPGKDGSAR